MTTSKKDYIRDVEETLQKWNDRLDELAVEVKTTAPERRHELESLIVTIIENRNFIEMQVKALKKSGDSWLNLRESVESAAKNIDANYRSALAYIM
ncbi:hypothetical protein [Desulfococcus sp.]|uniref:hypothetical protein n=1 Tax=Desulfococcus sp. TaxID=2025834 RepID=UPI0035933F46